MGIMFDAVKAGKQLDALGKLSDELKKATEENEKKKGGGHIVGD